LSRRVEFGGPFFVTGDAPVFRRAQARLHVFATGVGEFFVVCHQRIDAVYRRQCEAAK
jgi:hypothetical protein